MGAITIRKLDDAVIVRLKRRARANGRSMEEEARRVLEAAAAEAEPQPARRSDDPDVEELKALERERPGLLDENGRFRPGPELVDYMRRWQKATFGGRTFPSSVELLREIREEDPTRWSGE
jgi:plasmid stability protein